MPLVWPAELPQEPLLRWTVQLPQNVIRTETDSGHSKRRRRFTSAPRNYQMPFALRQAEYERFVQFFEEDTKDGSLPFEWQDPATGDTWEFSFVVPPAPQFAESPRGLYRGTLKLEARRIP
mgnify:CR=1 FL=1